MSTHAVAGRRSLSVALGLILLLSSMIVAPAVVLADDPPELEPIDPQIVTQAAEQDWSDYNPIPGSPYADISIEPTEERWNVGMILYDFPGTPFAVTQPQGST